MTAKDDIRCAFSAAAKRGVCFQRVVGQAIGILTHNLWSRVLVTLFFLHHAAYDIGLKMTDKPHGILGLLSCMALFPLVMDASPVPLRLRDGKTPYEGRIEVFYNFSWGTVCDDGVTNDSCKVVCRHLGLSGGVVAPTAEFGGGTGPIWLDGVTCDGTENSLNACKHNFWGDHDCQHSEDAACRCEPKLPPDNLTAACSKSHQRILPLDVAYPAIGRVEVKDKHGNWLGICDDNWDDLDAKVFCMCMGYTDSSHSHAFWSPLVAELPPPTELLNGTVHCTERDLAYAKNIDQCLLVSLTRTCDPTLEAAAVSCHTLPVVAPRAPPNVTVDCDGEMMTVCFHSDTYTMTASHLAVGPLCAAATPAPSPAPASGVCIPIPMEECIPKSQETDHSNKRYCYDVTYAKQDASVAGLVLDSVWSRTACCSVAKNGTVQEGFLPLFQEKPPIYSHDAPINFTLACYLDSRFSGGALSFPVTVSRGQELFCQVTAHTWDTDLQLVVPDCRFRARPSGLPEFTFLQNKCPTSELLGVNYYSQDAHTWGFKFKTPKFEGHDELYLSCDGYVCDVYRDHKPYCDRSCLSGASSGNNARLRRDLAVALGEMLEVSRGPFIVVDSQQGLLFKDVGKGSDGSYGDQPAASERILDRQSISAVDEGSRSAGHVTLSWGSGLGALAVAVCTLLTLRHG